MSTSTNQDDQHRPGEWPTPLDHTCIPARDTTVPTLADYYVLLGRIAAYIEPQPNRIEATDQAVHDLHEAVDNLPRKEAHE